MRAMDYATFTALSPQPLLIWLVADAVCAALLTLMALALLPSWRIGVVALSASWLSAAITLRS